MTHGFNGTGGGGGAIKLRDSPPTFSSSPPFRCQEFHSCCTVTVI